MRYEEALRVLEKRQESRIVLGLDRIHAHLGRMGCPQNAFPAVLVAGTNGKGSVCALLACVLRAQGYRTGLYTSPHLLEVRERIQVDGAMVDEEEFADCVAAALAAEKEPLTYFELLTAVAFEHFRRRKVEIAVLEVGLGGRLDATNAAGQLLLSIVTTIHFDHMELLGNTLARIASEKAGILRPAVPALTAEQATEPLQVLQEAARAVGAPLAQIQRPFRVRAVRWDESIQEMDGPGGTRFEVGLLGRAQAWNAALVHEAIGILSQRGFPVGAAAEAAGLRRVKWQCRFQAIAGLGTRDSRLGRRALKTGSRTPSMWLLDGAHNVQAMENLVQTLSDSPWGSVPLAIVLGLLKDKDAPGMVRLLQPFLRRVAVCPPPSPRALAPDILAQIVRRQAPEAAVAAYPNAASAMQAAAASGAQAVIVCGSFYLVGAALRYLQHDT